MFGLLVSLLALAMTLVSPVGPHQGPNLGKSVSDFATKENPSGGAQAQINPVKPETTPVEAVTVSSGQTVSAAQVAVDRSPALVPSAPVPTPPSGCFPKPPCLDTYPFCLIAEPVEGWCPVPSALPTPEPSPEPTPPSNDKPEVPIMPCLPPPQCPQGPASCEITYPIGGYCSPELTPVPTPSETPLENVPKPPVLPVDPDPCGPNPRSERPCAMP